MKPHTAAFLEAILFAYPEEDNGVNPYRFASVYDFSAPFIEAAEKFLDGFITYLHRNHLPCTLHPSDIGHNIYFSLSGHGCGFWDTPETEYLQAPLEAYAGGRYRFEFIELGRDERGLLDLAFLPQYRPKYRRKLFHIDSPASRNSDKRTLNA